MAVTTSQTEPGAACTQLRITVTLFTPSYTAPMGHWSESLVDEAMQQIGGAADRQILIELLAKAGGELEVLSGRSFRPARQTTSTFESNGLPFVDIPDALVGSIEATAAAEPGLGPWLVPDPVDHSMATVLQIAPLAEPVPNRMRAADALWFAGHLVAAALRDGLLAGKYVLHWLGSLEREERTEMMRRAMDPAVRISVPILGMPVEGWWIQISRRLVWVTNETEDEGRLLEPLLSEPRTGGEAIPLVAVEPVLIVAPMTRTPVDWAFTARVWPEGVQRPIERPWSKIAKAIHGHGIPTITTDPVSTPAEIACQVVLKGYWHGYIGSEGPALANAVALAYPKQVERIQRKTHAPNRTFAAATLLEQLIHPGFDPAQGAEATRRYVRRKASITVLEHQKAEAPDRYPWTQLGISERHYYKLLPLFAEKVKGRYVVDHGDVVTRMRSHLDRADNERDIRASALDVLRSHGFRDAAARKWLQRHPPEDAVNAWPRGWRPQDQ